MKFLVLALCVCAASAASLGYSKQQKQQYQGQRQRQQYQPQQVKAQAVAEPAVVSSYAEVQAVPEVPAAAAKAVYSAGKQTYVAGKDAYVASKDAYANVLRSDSEVGPDSFNFYYETENGISAQANGFTKEVNNEKVLGIQGSYRYIDVDGKEVKVDYIADENGFQPQSSILPVGPAIPDAILRSLEYLRTHAPAQEN